MFWTIYFLSVAFFCYFTFKDHKLRNEAIFLNFIMFSTPAQIDLHGDEYAPAIWTFFFNIVFQETISGRPLRPLALTMTLGILIYFLFSTIRKRFF